MNQTTSSAAFLSLLLVFLLTSTVVSGTGMAHRTEARRILLNLSGAEGGYLREVHSVSLKPGTNRIEVSMNTVNYVQDSFTVLPSSGEVKVNRVTFPDDRTALVVLESSTESIVTLFVQVQLQGFANESDYRARIGTESDRLNFRELMTIFNRSGQSFKKVWFGVGYGSWLQTKLEDGETKRIRIYEKEAVKFSRLYRTENAESKLSSEYTSLPSYYVFPNTSDVQLGDRALRRGKVRFYGEKEGSRVYLGEASMDHVPVGDTVSLEVGESKEVRARRQVVDRRRKNVRRNVHRQIQLYDEVMTYEYTVENNSENPARIILKEPMNGEWSVKDSTHDYSESSNNAYVLDLSLDSGQEETVRVTVELRDVMPSNR